MRIESNRQQPQFTNRLTLGVLDMDVVDMPGERRGDLKSVVLLRQKI